MARDPISETRSFLYLFARLLGDINAVRKGHVLQRVGRRTAGRMTGKGLGRIFDQWR